MTETPRLSFHPYEPDGSPRVFAGLFRPPFESLTQEDLLRILPTGMYAVPLDYQRQRWLAGALDRPSTPPKAKTRPA